MNANSFLVLSILLLNGCATPVLWEKADFHKPAFSPNLELSAVPARADVLVEYDEYSDRTDRIRTRAYFLEANARRLEKQRKPSFVNPKHYSDRKPIPVVASPSPALVGQLQATWDTNQFSIYSGEKELSSHYLPVYSDSVTRTTQVLLTPVTVLADVVLVGAAAGIIGWAYSGFYPLTK